MDQYGINRNCGSPMSSASRDVRHLPFQLFDITVQPRDQALTVTYHKRLDPHGGKSEILAPAQFDKKCCKQTLPCTNITRMHPMLPVKSTNRVRMFDTNKERNHSSQHQSSNCLDGKTYSAPGKCSGVTNDVRRKEPRISVIWIRSQQESWGLKIIGRSAWASTIVDGYQILRIGTTALSEAIASNVS